MVWALVDGLEDCCAALRVRLGFHSEVLGQFLGQCMRFGAVRRGWSPRKQALHTAQNREDNRMVMLAVEIKGLTYQ